MCVLRPRQNRAGTWPRRTDVLPCRCYLRHCVLAARGRGSPAALDSFLDDTFLARLPLCWVLGVYWSIESPSPVAVWLKTLLLAGQQVCWLEVGGPEPSRLAPEAAAAATTGM